MRKNMCVLAFALCMCATLGACGDSQSKTQAKHAAEFCADKHISALGFQKDPASKYSDFQDNTATPGYQRAMVALTQNGNYEIIDLATKVENGKEYCMAQLKISGTYAGNSYNGIYWVGAY